MAQLMPDGEYLDGRAVIGHVVWHLCPECQTWDGSYIPHPTRGRICGFCWDGRPRMRERGPVVPTVLDAASREFFERLDRGEVDQFGREIPEEKRVARKVARSARGYRVVEEPQP